MKKLIILKNLFMLPLFLAFQICICEHILRNSNQEKLEGKAC